MAGTPSLRTVGESLVVVMADLMEDSASDSGAYRLYDALMKHYGARKFDKKVLAEKVRESRSIPPPQPDGDSPV